MSFRRQQTYKVLCNHQASLSRRIRLQSFAALSESCLIYGWLSFLFLSPIGCHIAAVQAKY